MTFRILGFSALLLFTASCYGLPSLHSLVTFDKDPPAAEPAAYAAPLPEPAAPDDFCSRAAADTRAKAAADGFDTATQNRMVQQSFQQCVAMGQHG